MPWNIRHRLWLCPQPRDSPDPEDVADADQDDSKTEQAGKEQKWLGQNISA
jgi:hypothetical protein